MNVILVVSSHKEIAWLNGFLSPQEEAEFSMLLVEKRRNDWLSARYAAKKAFLQARPGCTLALREIIVAKSVGGEPYFMVSGSCQPYPLSLSHSTGYAIAAVGEHCRAIGVDMEKIEARPKCWAEDSFHPTEIPENADDRYYTELWAKKEAVLKALGIGLAADLFDVRFEGDGDRPTMYGRARKAWQERGAGKFTMQIHQMPEGCVTCVAILE